MGRLPGRLKGARGGRRVDRADLLPAENVTATLHVGGVTTSSDGRIAESVVANIERPRRGELTPAR
jgi:phosphoglycerate dehydrogenase-like enzyme